MLSNTSEKKVDASKKDKHDSTLFKDCNILRTICAHPCMLKRNETEDDESSDEEEITSNRE